MVTRASTSTTSSFIVLNRANQCTGTPVADHYVFKWTQSYYMYSLRTQKSITHSIPLTIILIHEYFMLTDFRLT